MIDAALLSPAWPLFAGALLLPLCRGVLRDAVFLAAPLAAICFVWLLPEGAAAPLRWFGLDLIPVSVDAFARLFGTAFAMAAFAGALFALDQPSVVERSAALLYAGAALGVAFAGDLATMFVFWEVMAIGSTLVIFANGQERAGLRYALMHVFGGVLFFAGLSAVAAGPEGITIRALAADSPGTWLLLAGILVNAGALPVSAWVADAYPRASWSGAVFLSAFTTKAAVIVLIRLFPGEGALIPIGIAMAVYGLVYALIENDIRRMLSYSIVGQVGFMVVAIGIGSPLALAAAAVHAFSHILYKSLLMMSAGAVLRATGESRLSELGGLARQMPVATAAMIVGGLSLAAFPLTAGFVSKSAIMASLGEAQAAVAWFALTAVSAGSFLYAALKLPWFAMFAPGNPRSLAPLPRSAKLAMLALAAANLGLGMLPSVLAHLMPAIAEVPVLTADHVLFQIQLLAGAGICFIMLLKLLSPLPRVTLDFDWFWRELPAAILASAGRWRLGISKRFLPFWEPVVAQLARFVPISATRFLESGNWRTGDIALAATALLGIALLIAAV